MFSDKRSVQHLIALCVQKGIDTVVVSPGSRNAPLVISFQAEPQVHCLTIADERSAAFFALGMAQQKQSPVALLCTSGSAALNYYPAVARSLVPAYPPATHYCRPAQRVDRPGSWPNHPARTGIRNLCEEKCDPCTGSTG